MNTLEFHHITVLEEELIQGLEIQPAGLYLDATVGGGGHSDRILAAYPDTRVIAIDRDQQALVAAKQRLVSYGDRVTFWQGNFADYPAIDQQFTGILADLGVSSAQLDQAERGFSFRQEAPLDMRMDQTQPITAADLLNTAPEKELADIFYYYGEERFSRRIARYIVGHRPFTTTTQLAQAIAHLLPGSRQRIHPATRVFQALRIAVNQELTSLEKFLDTVPQWLQSQGRIGIISFHSLEDRIVKHRFREAQSLRVLTKKPICPQDEELKQNPRSRSAKLRIAERLP
jgi:16S rRNA (cytosine1402-N4)-methyltransferase